MGDKLVNHLARFFSDRREAARAVDAYVSNHPGASKGEVFNEILAPGRSRLPEGDTARVQVQEHDLLHISGPGGPERI